MKCIICQCEIPEERAEAIKVLGNENNPTCIEHASNNKKKAVYAGFSGISPMILVDKVGTDETLWHEQEQEREKMKDFSYNLNNEE